MPKKPSSGMYYTECSVIILYTVIVPRGRGSTGTAKKRLGTLWPLVPTANGTMVIR